MNKEKSSKTVEIYQKSSNNKYRYALGEKSNKTLYCFGINPSTATLKKDDPTVRKVKNLAHKNEFDSVVMLNVYPQRATNPDCLDNEINLKEHYKNILKIVDIIEDGSVIWAAWGNLINKRPYLRSCLHQIQCMLKEKNIQWVKMGELTKEGNPRHPLYLKYQSFSEYSVV